MASGTIGADNSREKHRWGEGNKVYTRKIHHKGLKNTAATTPTTATATAAATNNKETTTTTTTATDNNHDNNDNSNSNKNVPQQSVQTLATINANSPPPQLQQQQALPRLDAAASNDSPSHIRPSEPPNGNGAVKPVVTRVDDRVKINLAAAKSKDEIRELRTTLVSELDQVRGLVKKLEATEAQLTAKEAQLTAKEAQLAAKEAQLAAYSTTAAGNPYGHSQNLANDVIERRALVRGNSDMHSDNNVIERRVLLRGSSDVHLDNNVIDRRALLRVNSEVGSVGHQDSRPFRHLTVSVANEYVEKEKRTPKANQYYRNSDFLLGKDRLPHPESNKKLKSNGGRKHGGEMDYGFGSTDKYRNQAFKSCNNLLQRLMKHKHGWVFNEPVNAKALGLHDYHDIIKRPMDLGTVKSRLAQNFYKFPREFAEDVRLTFRNAMTYNPKGQDVHIMAEQLSNIFEERWAVIEAEYNPDWRYEIIHDAGLPTPTSRKAPTPLSVPQMRTFDRSESMTATVDSRLKLSNFAPVSRTPVPKKPKAKDPNKRDMTFEEKQRLSSNLQSLPSEKLDSIVQIIKKRNLELSQHGDEIEVDIDSVDAETLWELDRFVTNYKKSLSKNKRKAELALQARAEAGRAVPVTNLVPAVVEAPKESKTGEKNVANSSPGQGEKQGDNVSRSSSSSSSSSDSGSSSSDSDSDSSSADGSDAAHSPRA